MNPYIMGAKTIIIIDENQEALHQIGILLTGKGFRLATSDNIDDAILMFQLRDFPDCIFLSDTISDRTKFLRHLKTFGRSDFQLIPIRDKPNSTGIGKEKVIYRPFSANDFLGYIC